ncbi:MAG TPA: hypothetical protein VE261_07310, partial [Gaiellaceae bacterium]|nr:hypothetical protein [Gaiellaceae bacterium]
RARRMAKHRAAAEWIASISPDRSEDRAEMLAHHYREALRLAEASGADTTPFREPALAALKEASTRAAALGSWAAAADLAAEALTLGEDPELQLRLARAKAFGNADIDIPLAESARDGLLREGKIEGAAEAEAFLGWACWWIGDGEGQRAHAAASVQLACDLPTSYAKAFAYARAGRLEGIGGDPARGIELANQTLAMAEELDSDGLRSDALNTRGISKRKLGDLTAIDDLRRSVELADASTDAQQMATARNNLASILGSWGRLREAIAAAEEARDVGLRFGSIAAAQWPAMQLVVFQMLLGDPTALHAAEELRGEVSPDSQVHSGLMFVRGYVLVRMGRFAEAEDAIEESLTAARIAGDAQAVVPALRAKLALHVLSDRRDEANVVVDELLASTEYSNPGLPGDLALPLVELGREADWPAAASVESPWADAGAAVVRGDLVRAAEIYGEIGARFSEAWARLVAAERGDLSQLERAREFFVGYGAQPFIERCDAVLAASA